MGEGKLLVAGPFGENGRAFEGIFIFNAATTAEVAAIMQSDAAVAAGRFSFEVIDWYGSAAIQELVTLHQRIDKVGLYR